MHSNQDLAAILIATVFAVGVGMPATAEKVGTLKPKPISIIELTDEAREIHKSAIVIDGHNDLPWALRDRSSFDEFDIAKTQADLHTDIPRLRAGGMGAQFWSVFVPASTTIEGTALKTTLEQIELVHEMARHYPNVFEIALSTADIERIHREGKIASLIGVEGGHSIENSLNVLHRLYDLGARYMTLTHSKNLAWADSCTDEPQCGGLSPFGEEVIREMNRLGMLVDISHVTADCMRRTLQVTTAPVIFSHSSAKTIANHPRNVPDDVLRLTKKNGGVVMINFFSSFIQPEAAALDLKRMERQAELEKKYPEDRHTVRAEMKKWYANNPPPDSTIHDVLDHIDQVIKIAGVDHVGLGSDYDGVPRVPIQLEDVSTYPYITQGLLDRGYRAEDIRKILGGNLMRAFRKAEQVAAELQAP